MENTMKSSMFSTMGTMATTHLLSASTPNYLSRSVRAKPVSAHCAI
jgi:hypothetical protein